MSKRELAVNYATSLFKLLDDPVAVSQLRVIASIFEGKEGIHDFFEEETITDSQREAWVEEELASFLPVIKKLIVLLDENKRVPLLEAIALQYENLIREKNTMERIYIKTATPASRESIEKIVIFFEEKMGIELRAVPTVDPAVIGGVSVHVAGKLYDDTIQSKLNKLLNELHADE